MSMSKKDYEAIATDIRRRLQVEERNGNKGGTRALRNLTRSLCESFAEDNPRFNRHTFVTACTGYDLSSQMEDYYR